MKTNLMRRFFYSTLIVLALWVMGNRVNAQIDPTGPQMLAETVRQTSILTQVMTGIEFLEQHAEKIEKAVQAVESVEILGSLAEVYRLINSIACMSKDLNILMQQTSSRDDCLINFKYQYPITNLNAVGDLLDLALEVESLITKKDRVDAINEAGSKVKEAGEDIILLKDELAWKLYGQDYIKNRVSKNQQVMFLRRQF